MKTFLNILACVVVLVVAAMLGSALGFFKAPALDSARNYSWAYVTWAAHGFKGSPDVGGKASEAALPEATGPTADQQQELAHLVDESKRRAVAKYPELGVINTEINSRFKFRYGRMLQEKSPRLQESTWPELLADECAAASKVRSKPTGDHGSGVVGSKKMVASSVP